MRNDPHRYDDIIDLPHFEPKNHSRMSLNKRAAQFSPFAALTGYGDAIDEEARYTDSFIELSEDASVHLDRKLRLVREKLSEHPAVRITWFKPDERKEGGSFIDTRDRLWKIDENTGILILKNGLRIPISDIMDIDFIKQV